MGGAMYRELERRALRELKSMGYPPETLAVLNHFLSNANSRWKISRDMSLSIEQRRHARERALRGLCYVIDFICYTKAYRMELCTPTIPPLFRK